MAIEALKEQSTLAEPTKKYEVSPTRYLTGSQIWLITQERHSGVTARAMKNWMGVRQMVDYLKREGFKVGSKLVRRLMALMDIRAIYPMKSLSEAGWEQILP